MADTPMTIPRGMVKIVLDKERHLKLTLNTLIEVQEYLGADDIPTMFVGRKFSGADIRYILFLLLRHEDAALTPEQVGDLCTFEVVSQFDALLQGVVEQAFGPFERLVGLLVDKLVTKLVGLVEALGTGAPSMSLPVTAASKSVSGN